MLAGDPPFKGRSVQAVLARHVSDPVPPIRSVRPQLQRGLDEALGRALAKVPADRYGSAGDLIAALHTPRKTVAMRRWGVAALVAVTIAAFLVWTFRPEGAVPHTARAYTQRPLTFSRFWETSPHWSPGGDLLAFGRMTAGSVGLFVQPAAGGEEVKCVDGPGDEIAPRWSLDGKYLAYVSSSQQGTPVCLVPPQGGRPRVLVETKIPTLDVDSMMFALGDRPWRDSKTLLATLRTDSGQFAIFRIDLDGESPVQMTFPPVGSDDFSGTHSFDGERIVFSRRTNGRGMLFTMPAGGGEIEGLLADDWDYTAPAWRPDGQRVVFLSDRGGAYASLWEIDLRTRSPVQLTSETRTVLGAFSVSSDDRIAYTPFWHDTYLYSVEVETGETRPLTTHIADNFGSRFSPDDRSIAYHSTRVGDCEIFLHHLDDDRETNLTEDPSWDLFPDWSPDGDRILFVSNREDGAFKVFTMDRAGGNLRKLVDQPINMRIPYFVNASLVARWSPEGDEIAYMVSGEHGSALWTVRRDGDDPRSRLDDVEGFDWYMDHRRGVYSRSRGGVQELVAVDLETGAEHVLWTGPHTELDVAPDGSAVLFSSGQGHLAMGLSLLRLRPPAEPGGLPTQDGDPQDLVRSEGTWHVHHGSWSADSKSIVYTQDEDFGDIFELVERQ